MAEEELLVDAVAFPFDANIDIHQIRSEWSMNSLAGYAFTAPSLAERTRQKVLHHHRNQQQLDVSSSSYRLIIRVM